jgi:hypothetical protein
LKKQTNLANKYMNTIEGESLVNLPGKITPKVSGEGNLVEERRNETHRLIHSLASYFCTGSESDLRSSLKTLGVATETKRWNLAFKGLNTLRTVLHNELQTETLDETLKLARVAFEDVPAITGLFQINGGTAPSEEAGDSATTPTTPADILPPAGDPSNHNFRQKALRAAEKTLKKIVQLTDIGVKWTAEKTVAGTKWTATALRKALKKGAGAYRQRTHRVQVGYFSLKEGIGEEFSDRRTATNEFLLKIASHRIVVESLIVGLIIVEGSLLQSGIDRVAESITVPPKEEDRNRLILEDAYGIYYSGPFLQSERDLFARSIGEVKGEPVTKDALKPSWVIEHINRMSRFEQRDVALISLAEALDGIIENNNVITQDHGKFVSYFTGIRSYSADEAEWLWNLYNQVKGGLTKSGSPNFDNVGRFLKESMISTPVPESTESKLISKLKMKKGIKYAQQRHQSEVTEQAKLSKRRDFS